MPRARFLQKALRGSAPPQPMPMASKQVAKVPEKKKFDPSLAAPSEFSKYSQQLHSNFTAAVAENKPHFVIGGKEIYFPWAPITLLRPSARMTPYQAQFQVPREFNKMDLRDYLWHIYGLRALNITTQIKWSEWVRRRMSRFRTPQVKKMIIDMDQPFVWPAEDMHALETHRLSASRAFNKYETEMNERKGSDLKKPAKAFDGIMGPYPDPPRSFVSQRVMGQLKNAKKEAAQKKRKQDELRLVNEYANWTGGA